MPALQRLQGCEVKTERLNLEKLRTRFREKLAADRGILEHLYCPLMLEQLEMRLDARFSIAWAFMNLTWRERDVLVLVSMHVRDKEIADVLGVSVCTVRSYIQRLMRKFGVSSRRGLEAVVSAAKPVGRNPIEETANLG